MRNQNYELCEPCFMIVKKIKKEKKIHKKKMCTAK